MSMKLFDYKCNGCGLIQERLVKRGEEDEQFHQGCGHPPSFMKRMPAAPAGAGNFASPFMRRKTP